MILQVHDSTSVDMKKNTAVQCIQWFSSDHLHLI